MPTTSLVAELKAADQDHEFYPTTNEIIQALAEDIGLYKPGEYCHREHTFESVLDIGAGHGKVLMALKKLCDFRELFAIEKSSVLCRAMDQSILVVGTEFDEQSLMSKPVDIVYCNPPYSQFEAWAVRVIRESAAKRVYLCIPQRWAKSTAIADALTFRAARGYKIGDFDFADAEDRQARAKVHLVRVDLRHEKDDAFDRWFGEQFADVINKFKQDVPQCAKCGTIFDPESKSSKDQYYCTKCSNYSDGNGGRKRPFESLVAGPNYPEALVQLYNDEMAHIQKNYQAVARLDPDLMREFEILPARIMACLKARMSGLKNDYWMELFSHLDTITNRLTSTSRKELLNVLHKHVQVDFTVSNILEVVIWVIKNANSYIEKQLILLYEKMAEKANVLNYKSNRRVFTANDWRYLRGWDRSGTPPTNFKLDYRIVLQSLGGCRPHYGTIQLAESAADFMGDLMTVAANLGFRTEHSERYAFGYQERRNWTPGEKREFFCINRKTNSRELLFDVRAFQNGNCHFRINQELMLALNVEFGRLKGWLRNPQQAVDELNEPTAAQYFQTNCLLAAGDVPLMLGAGASQPNPETGKPANCPICQTDPECLTDQASPIIPPLAAAGVPAPAWRRRTVITRTPVLI